MGKQLSLLFALVLTGGCSAAHEGLCDDRLHATVTIEETGEEIAVDEVGWARSSGIVERSDIVLVFIQGQLLWIEFTRPSATGSPLSLGAEAPDVRVVISHLTGACRSSAMSEGELVLDYIRHGEEFVNCIGGSLRVRFADCDAEVFGRPASETTFLVELGRR